MFGEPRLADESELRLPAAFGPPRHLSRKDAEDSDADDEPHEVHQQTPSLFMCATTRE
jgi:hypothetical protein